MEKKAYVAGFMFSPDFENVILIQKEKPEWQKGKYNAVGGKIEDGELPQQAMAREFKEEAWIETKPDDWKPLCRIGDGSYIVFFFYTTNEKWRDYLTTTDEEVFHIPVMDISLKIVRHNLIENLNWLIPLALDKAKRFSGDIVI